MSSPYPYTNWTGTSGQTYFDEMSVKWLWGFLQTGACIKPDGSTLITSGLGNNALGGLFGNLYQESHCCPFELQGWESQYSRCWDYVNDYSRQTRTAYAFSQETYGGGTKGFGLAQWTEQSRKEDLWRYSPTLSGIVKNHTWLGDMERDANYLLYDLYTWSMHTSANENLWSAQGKTVWQWLSDPNVTIDDAVNAVLMIYERPFATAPSYQQWQTEFNLRRGYADGCLLDFAGIIPPPTPPTPPTPTPTGSLPIWLYFKLKEGGTKNVKPYDGIR